MAQAGNNENWLIFIDTNIFLDFYRLGGESATKQLEALERHKDSIIMCDQVRMEFLKNRQKVIAKTIQEFKNITPPQVPPILTDHQTSKMLRKHSNKASSQFKKVQKKIEQVLSDPIKNDPVYKLVNKIFKNNGEFNLKRPDKDRYRIRHLARKRFAMGYPPKKPTDHSCGDAINWEWIIECAHKSEDNHNILIVSRDTDYGISYGNESFLNDWLKREFKDRISRKRKIELTNKLTVALKRLDEQVTETEEQEEQVLIEESSNDWDNISRGLGLSPSAFLLYKKMLADQNLQESNLGLIGAGARFLTQLDNRQDDESEQE